MMPLGASPFLLRSALWHLFGTYLWRDSPAFGRHQRLRLNSRRPITTGEDHYG